MTRKTEAIKAVEEMLKDGKKVQLEYHAGKKVLKVLAVKVRKVEEIEL